MRRNRGGKGMFAIWQKVTIALLRWWNIEVAEGAGELQEFRRNMPRPPVGEPDSFSAHQGDIMR